MNDQSGQNIDRYHLIEKLGEGGMAVVYKAFDTHLECEVAVKLIRMDRLTPEMMQSTLKRFEREAKSLAQLTHANIVKVTDYGELEGVPYLVMEYLPGGTVKKFLGTPMPYTDAAKLLLPIARALQFAHEHKIVHRDIKPANILITESGEPMLTDFGIAKILDLEEGQTLTGTGVGIGTPEYMSPEQWEGNITPAVDIYSLGVVFYELVTGHKPYSADTPAAVLIKSFNDPLPRPSSFVPGLPDAVEQVLFKVLAKKPEDRYATMREFEKALEGLATGVSGATTLNAPVKVADIKKQPTSSLESDKTIQKKVESVSPPDFQPTLAVKKEPIKPVKKNKLPLWIGLGIIGLLGFALLIIKGPAWFAPQPSPTPMPTAVPNQVNHIPTITSMPEVINTLSVTSSAPVTNGSNFLACEVTDSGGINDNSFNASAWRGVVLAEQKLGINGVYTESKDQTDYQNNINAFISKKCDLIITVGFLLSDATKAAAEANPNVRFTIVDFAYDPILPNVVGQVYQTDEASFLAGYLAAGMSKTKMVGTFGGMQIPTVTIFMDGFVRGVSYYNQVHGSNVLAVGWDTNSQSGLFSNDFGDPKIGQDYALQLLNKGADIIFPVAGQDGLGAAPAVQSFGNAYVIGVDDDWALTMPEYQGIVLTSVIKLMDETILITINSAMDGTFKGGPILGNLANGGVGLAPYHSFDNQIPESLKTELNQVKQDIISGKIIMNPTYAQ